jgi:hypothetical protein
MCARLEGIVDPARKHNLKPMKQRKAELLAKIQKRGPGGWGTNSINFFEPVLGKLIKDGDVRLKRIIYRSGFNGANRTAMVATWFPEMEMPRYVEPHRKKREAAEAAGQHFRGENQGSLRVDTKKIMWTKEKNDKLLVDALRGEADPELVKEIGRIKTKYRKITINSSKKRDSNE